MAAAVMATIATAAAMTDDFASTMAAADTPIRGKFLSSSLYDDVMHELPIPTADVLILSSDLSRTLLFNRTNKPVQRVFYSIGGRVFKNEHLKDAAMRKLKKELPMLGSMVSAEHLILGGVMEEIFSDSMFNDTNSHCINSVFGLVLPEGRPLEAALLAARHDSQASRAKWFDVDDRAGLHPYMREKLRLLSLQAPALAERTCAPHSANETACTSHVFNLDGVRLHCEWQQSESQCLPPPSRGVSRTPSSCARGDAPAAASHSLWRHGGFDRAESALLLTEGTPMKMMGGLQAPEVGFFVLACLVLSFTAKFLWQERRAAAGRYVASSRIGYR